MALINPATASAVIDLEAYRRNLRTLTELAGGVDTMAVVKADGYGHGMLPCAGAARSAGVDWLGVATPAEALALREGGDDGPVLCWLYGPDEDLTAPVAARITVTASDADQLSRLVAAAAVCRRTAEIQLKIDTGLSRNGSPEAEWAALCAAAAEAERAGAVTVTGIWSHLAAADEPDHPANRTQRQRFERASEEAAQAGLRPRWRHLANSAGAMVQPALRYDLVRLGIASYGVEPGPGLAAAAGIRLEPVMSLRAQLVAVKPLPAGESVSYGHLWTAAQDTTVGLVPLGYADGIPRNASNDQGNPAHVQVGGRRAPVRGRICMDQFVIDLGPQAADRVGDDVIIFGAAPAPTAENWAALIGTIGYEIVSRVGTRIPRIHLGEAG